MDITQSLKDTENSLRDFIQARLIQKLGDDWVQKCGVSSERINKWEERKQIELKRHFAGTVEERILYYSDFYDLKTILEKNWSSAFSEVFGKWKEVEVFLSVLEKYRDTDAHRRELLSYQKYLILGIGGEIRSKIVKFRSMKETGEDYFPRFESVRDNYGSAWVTGEGGGIHSNIELKPGDDLEFIVAAFDPDGLPLEYKIKGYTEWQSETSIQYKVQYKDIGFSKPFLILLRSSRDYHAYEAGYDHAIDFYYTIVPS